MTDRKALIQYIKQTLARLDGGFYEAQLKSKIMPQVVESIKRLSAGASKDTVDQMKRVLLASAVLPDYQADAYAFKGSLQDVLAVIDEAPLAEAAEPGCEEVNTPVMPGMLAAPAEDGPGNAEVTILDMGGSVVVQQRFNLDEPLRTMQDQVCESLSTAASGCTAAEANALSVLQLCLNCAKLEASETLAVHGITHGQQVDITAVRQYVQISGIYASSSGCLLTIMVDGRIGFNRETTICGYSVRQGSSPVYWKPPVIHSFQKSFVPGVAGVPSYNNVMKEVKVFREILKLEEQAKSKKLQNNQLAKLAKKSECLNNIASLAPDLPPHYIVPDDILQSLKESPPVAKPAFEIDDWKPHATTMLNEFSFLHSLREADGWGWGRWKHSEPSESSANAIWMQTIRGNVNTYDSPGEDAEDCHHYTFEAVAKCDSKEGLREGISEHFLDVSFSEHGSRLDGTDTSMRFYLMMHQEC